MTSRRKVNIKKDQGWYSESEMRQDLKWTAFLDCIFSTGFEVKIINIVLIHSMGDHVVCLPVFAPQEPNPCCQKLLQ